jgi:hypothetical protein
MFLKVKKSTSKKRLFLTHGYGKCLPFTMPTRGMNTVGLTAVRAAIKIPHWHMGFY